MRLHHPGTYRQVHNPPKGHGPSRSRRDSSSLPMRRRGGRDPDIQPLYLLPGPLGHLANNWSTTRFPQPSIYRVAVSVSSDRSPESSAGRWVPEPCPLRCWLFNWSAESPGDPPSATLLVLSATVFALIPLALGTVTTMLPILLALLSPGEICHQWLLSWEPSPPGPSPRLL